MAKDRINTKIKKSQSSKPYDVSNSFVKRVASRVSELLPQSFTKWWSPSSECPISENENRENLNCEEDEDDEAVDITSFAPPLKRAKIPLPQSRYPISTRRFPASCSTDEQGEATFHDRSSIPNLNHDPFVDDSLAGPSGAHNIRYPISSTPARPEDVGLFQAPERNVQINGDDQSDSSESTSGCSSLVPQADRHETSKNTSLLLFQNKTQGKEDCTKRLSLSSIEGTRYQNSGLFDLSKCPQPQPSASSNRRPSFSISPFSSPVWGGEKTHIKDRIVNSPFYSGMTTYGGASAYQKHKHDTSNSSYVVNLKPSLQVKPVKAVTSDNASMSHTARKILETLEQVSSPISDAKRIPIDGTSSRKRPRPSSVVQQSRNSNAEPNKSSSLGPPLTTLIVPTVPDLLKMRSGEKMSNAAKKTIILNKNSADASYRLRSEEPKGSKHTNKIKSKDVEVELAEEVNLPNIPLPITKLPEFDFSIPTTTNPSSTAPAMSFKFSAPIPARDIRTSSVPSTFTFSSPITACSSQEKEEVKSGVPVNNLLPSLPEQNKIDNSTSLPVSRSSGNLARPSIKSVVMNPHGGHSSLAEQKSDFAMDTSNKKFVAEDKQRTTNRGDASSEQKLKQTSADSSESVLFAGAARCSKCSAQIKSGSVKCSACESGNKSTDAKKVTQAAGTAKSSKTMPVAVVEPGQSFGAQFKLAPGLWECGSCLIRNKESDVLCVACKTPKPCQDSKAVESNNSVQNSSTGFGDKFKPPKDTWECSVCMVRNASSLSKCQACETKNPNYTETKSDSQNNSQITEESWNCSVCLLKNYASSSKCVACESPKDGVKSSSNEMLLPPTGVSGFKFGVDNSGLLKNNANIQASSIGSGFKLDSVKPNVESKGFTFGVQPTTSENKTSVQSKGFTFGVPPTSDNKTSVDSKGFTFGVLPSTLENKTSGESKGFTFGAQPPASENKTSGAGTLSTNMFTFGNNSKPETDKKSSHASEDKAPVKESEDKEISKPSDFSFGVPTGSNNATGPMFKVPSVPDKSAPISNKGGFKFALGGFKSEKTSVIAASSNTRETSEPPSKRNSASNSTPSDSGASNPPPNFGSKSENITFPVSPAVTSTSLKKDSKVQPESSNLFMFGNKSTTSNPSLSFPVSTNSAPVFGTPATGKADTPSSSSFQSSISAFKKPANEAVVTPSTSAVTAISSGFGAGAPVSAVTQPQSTKTCSSFVPSGSSGIFSTSSSSAFANVATTPSVFGNTAVTQSSFQFGAGSTSTTTVPTFGTPTTSSQPTFGTAKTTVPNFGTSVTSNVPAAVTTPFNFGTKPTTASINFGSSAPATKTTPSIGFGTTTTSSMFGTGMQPATTTVGAAKPSFPFSPVLSKDASLTSGSNKQDLFAFGSTTSASSGGFNFGASQTTQAGSGFNFGSTQNSSSMQPGYTFGASSQVSQPGNFDFGAGSKTEQPVFGSTTPSLGNNTLNAGTSLFGSGTPATAMGSSTAFGSSGANPFGGTGTSNSFTPQNFNFNASQPSSNVFGFGGNTGNQGQPSASGFPFGQNQPASKTSAVTFDPNVRPTFNFSGGITPVFSATPNANSVGSPAAQRPIKKAVRRTQPRKGK